jgi:NAD(P)-dependent dehydrogenase (short-subunit alcohol dehydrogenase family)
MNGKICIVTGSNTGIGKTTAIGLAQRGATVVLAVRDVNKGMAAREEIAKAARTTALAVMPLDLGDFASIRAFARAFTERYSQLDVLVNNAGVTTRTRAVTKSGFETTFGTNHLGTALLTIELVPILQKSAPSRIVVVSSDLHYRGKMRWDDLDHAHGRFSGLAAYNQSKLANVLFTKALARRLDGTGVTVNTLHPGVIATELTREYPKPLVALWKMFLLSPERGAECTLHVSTAPELESTSGEYFEKSRPKSPSRDAHDEKQQEQLWAITRELLGAVNMPFAA